MTSRPRKLADRIAAQFALLRARRLLRHAPIGALTARRAAQAATARNATAAASSARTDDARHTRARAIADAVRWTAAHGLFRPFCLVQSLALQELLAAEGIHDSEIRVGVRRDGSGLHAHAWIRWRGEVLGDDPAYVRGFIEVDDLSVLDRR